MILALACGSSNSGSKVGEVAQPIQAEDTKDDESSSTKFSTYSVGDVVAVEDQTIVLNSFSINGNKLQANFTIENMGDKDLNISSLLSFSARDSEGTELEIDIMSCGGKLDGGILPGDKMKGDICWDGMATDSAKIYYEANLFSSGAVVWEVTR